MRRKSSSLAVNRRSFLFILFLSVLVLVLARPVTAQLDPAGLCDQAIRAVSDETDVPLAALKAITRRESPSDGTNALATWPWTVTIRNHGIWFDTESQAMAYVFRKFKAGERQFEVGCLQVSYKWHSAEFASVEEMFEPLANTRVAAKLLSEMHQELGDWEAATSAFRAHTTEFVETSPAPFIDLSDPVQRYPAHPFFIGNAVFQDRFAMARMQQTPAQLKEAQRAVMRPDFIASAAAGDF